MNPLDTPSLNQLFYNARTQSKWQNRPLDDAVIKKLYQLTRMGPTSMNCCPARFIFVKSPEAKNKLVAAMSPGNIDKMLTAPITVIITTDQAFYTRLPQLVPHQEDAMGMFQNNPALSKDTAFRNACLQGAYMIMAARSLGLDCGPMSGFDRAKVDELFFSDSNYESNFLINIGYGDSSQLHQRSPRLDFDEACQII